MSNQDEYPSTLETVTTTDSYTIKRLKVPGGWLVLIRDSTYSTALSEFVSDVQHHWDIES